MVAIDLLEMPEIPGVSFAQLDFLADDAPDKLLAMMGGRADVVLSDMAANTTGHRKTDQLRILGLVESAAPLPPTCSIPAARLWQKYFRAARMPSCWRSSSAILPACACQAGLEPAGFLRALCAGDGFRGQPSR